MNTTARTLSNLRSGLMACALVLTPAAGMAQSAQPSAGVAAVPDTSAGAPGARQQRPAGGGNGFEGKDTPDIRSGKWTGKRLPDGQPDVSGDWSNTIANHNNTTDPQGGIPNDPQGRSPKTTRAERAPSRVSDPPDGQLPYLPWARAIQIELAHGFFDGSKPEYIEPLARCAPAGIPKSFYWHGYEIRQYPGYVLFLFNSGSRIVHLDDPKHLPENIKLWQGDSRGHWEGNTLVVDVSNLNSKARFGRTAEFTSESVHVVERFIFDNDNKRYNYVAAFTDPTVFSRPFTVTVPARRWTVADKTNGWHYEVPLANNPGKEPIGDHYERICVENNGGFGRGTAQAAK
jgi:hypothetical protein